MDVIEFCSAIREFENNIFPFVGFNSDEIIFNKVVFPKPLFATIEYNPLS